MYNVIKETGPIFEYGSPVSIEYRKIACPVMKEEKVEGGEY